MESELSFGADCVLTLEDIGEFKDYTETIEKLIVQMSTPGLQVQEWLPELLQLTKADPEDVYYLPVFLELLKLLIAIDWTQQQIGSAQLARLIQFELLLVEECLLSLTLGQEALSNLVKKCQKYTKYADFQSSLLWMLFRLSDKVVYIEDYESIAILWGYLDEEMILQRPSLEPNLQLNKFDPNDVNIKAAAYLEACEKFARNSKIRRSLRGLPHLKNIIRARLAVAEGNGPLIEECKERLSKVEYFGSDFLKSMLQSWDPKVSQ